MIENMLNGIETIYIAYGATDFRCQINSLCKKVEAEYEINPYSKSKAFIFCNRKRTSIKVLSFDRNGFVLAQKKLLDSGGIKFQWPRNEKQLKSITKEQLMWLLSGLEIYPKKYFKEVEIDRVKIVK